MKKYTTHTITQRYGMEGLGDTAYEWLTPEEIKASNERHSAYIDDCKLKGIYGKEYTLTLKLEHDPLYDDIKRPRSCESYRMDIIDLTKL